MGVRNRMLFAIDWNLGVGMLVFGREVCIVIVTEVSIGIEIGIGEEGIWKFVEIEQSFDWMSAIDLQSG